jgi:23S rRNA (guanine2445-N2)-methyltransferase / 23S rRNA (guanine2069-N7)-methyltransferase
LKFFVPCPPGAEDVLTGELRNLGAGSIIPGSRGVGFEGDLNLSYAACLRLRTASRILMELISDRAGSEDDLYRLAVAYPWETLFPPTLSISCRVTGVPRDKDPRFATLRLKDAIVDRFNNKMGKRPYVEKKLPDIRIEARWDGRDALVYLNWSGPALHERGYRLERTDAVLRETTAAAVLALTGWPDIVKNGGDFVDPVCGSGTLLVEAAMMAVNAAPGIHRKTWGFEGSAHHNDDLWRHVRNEAVIQYGESLEKMPLLAGFDNDENALRAARSNLRRAGLNNIIRLERHDITRGRPEFWPLGNKGLVCADPPYGVRIAADPTPVYEALGTIFRELESGWRMAVLAPDRKTAAASFLRAERYHHMVSGGMDLVLAVYDRIGPSKPAIPVKVNKNPVKNSDRPSRTNPEEKPDVIKEAPDALDPKAPSLRISLQRNLDAMKSWAERTNVSSYRIWDADMPEFNAVVDWYEGKWLHVQEFAAPGKIPQETTRMRLETLLTVLKEVTGCKREDLYLKTRQRGIRPHSKMGDTRDRFIIRENGMRFYVNFIDYMDTGIFLDHRPTRAIIRDRIGKGRFLNLFSYTGTASVMAAAGGAGRTVNVDVSDTYLSWAKDNMKLNRLDGRSNAFVRSDIFDFLKNQNDKFDMIFIDPPTYSNGVGRNDWSVQDNHAQLINLAMENLNNGGTLLFSENFRRFTLDSELKNIFSVHEITRETTDPDFAARAKSHRCWEFSHQP